MKRLNVNSVHRWKRTCRGQQSTVSLNNYKTAQTRVRSTVLAWFLTARPIVWVKGAGVDHENIGPRVFDHPAHEQPNPRAGVPKQQNAGLASTVSLGYAIRACFHQNALRIYGERLVEHTNICIRIIRSRPRDI